MKPLRDRATIYLRVSTGQQAEKELPLDTQRDMCEALVKKRGWKLNLTTDIYVDQSSGRKIKGRGALVQLLERCKTDPTVAAVVIYDISRWARNATDYPALKAILKHQGVSLISVNEPMLEEDTPTSWILEHVLVGFAEWRSRQDGEKIKNSMRVKAESGVRPGKAPYGYKNVQEQVSSNKSKRWIEVDEEYAPWVARTHELYATGKYGMRELTEKLYKEGMRVERSKKLGVSRIERILKDRVYIGYVEWGGVINPDGKHEHLVDEEVFYKNQMIMKARNAGASRKRKHLFVLRTIGAKCGECGSRWTAGYHTGKSGKKFGLYSCTKRQRSKTVSCAQSSIKIEELEKQFELLFKKVQLPPSLVKKIRERVKVILERDEVVNESLHKSLQEKLEHNRASQRRLLEKYADGKVSDSVYEELSSDRVKEAEMLEKNITNVDSNMKQTKYLLELALSLAGDCHRSYKKAQSDELRALLGKAFFKSLVIKDGKIANVELNYPFHFLSESKVRKVEEFQLAYVGGDGGNRTRVQ